MSVVFSFTAVTMYLIAIVFVVRELSGRHQNETRLSKQWLIITYVISVTLHFVTLAYTTFTPGGFDFGIFNIGSIIAWLICVIFLLLRLRHTVDHLGLFVLPLACFTILLKLLYPESLHLTDQSWQLKTHVTLSLLAYSILSLAAIQAVLFAVQNHHLHNRNPTGFIRVLPPLNAMEALLFQLIAIGFITLTLALISGFVFLENMFQQHLVHKTVLSIIAWAGFGVLLWGRYRYGWRGKKATRWTLAGSIILMLAYFGSKTVIELIL